MKKEYKTSEKVRAASSRTYYRDPQRGIARAAAWNRNNRERRAHGFRLRRYGLTEGQFAEMLQAQNSACAICHSTLPGGNGTWQVDHDHETGQVRGLLCQRCNVKLGWYEKSKPLIEAFEAYLQKAKKA